MRKLGAVVSLTPAPQFSVIVVDLTHATSLLSLFPIASIFLIFQNPINFLFKIPNDLASTTLPGGDFQRILRCFNFLILGLLV